MEYQKIINLLHNTPSQTCKFKTKIWVDASATHDKKSQITFKT